MAGLALCHSFADLAVTCVLALSLIVCLFYFIELVFSNLNKGSFTFILFITDSTLATQEFEIIF